LNPQILLAQQTMGLFYNDEQAFDGYTLFSPNAYSTTYLIDNCGREVHRWNGNLLGGGATYLLENGNLLQTLQIGSPTFFGGGTSGRIEQINWDGDLVWEYEYATEDVHQHHDVAYLPNGNILLLAWERKSVSEAIENGRNPNLLGTSLWPEHIVEVQPDEVSGGIIVWEWHFWDHLVQDFDPTKLNYGVVADHPELLDINYLGNVSPQAADWQHCNSVDYNAERDEIIISSRNFNEFYIIDHSTTTEEAAGHVGGNSGRGGDLLYRWGNPMTYQRGTIEDRKSFGQHDVHWIKPGLADAGKIMFFNNGIGRPGGAHSTVDIIEPPLDTNGKYLLEADMPYGPEELSWTYESTPTSDFFSPNISGAQRLPNDNVLVCEGATGSFFEVDTQGDLHWSYINPVNQGGPMVQESNPVFNAVFRTYRYAPNYSAFNGRDLTPGDLIELDPLPSDCELTTNLITPVAKRTIVYPNPFKNYIMINSDEALEGYIRITDALGHLIFTTFINEKQNRIDLPPIRSGLYFLTLPNGQTSKLIAYLR